MGYACKLGGSSSSSLEPIVIIFQSQSVIIGNYGKQFIATVNYNENEISRLTISVNSYTTYLNEIVSSDLLTINKTSFYFKAEFKNGNISGGWNHQHKCWITDINDNKISETTTFSGIYTTAGIVSNNYNILGY